MTPRQQVQSANHPAKGDIITAEPLRTFEQVAEVKEYLSRHSLRDLALLTLGINTNLRASDIIRLTVSDVQGNELLIREKKTGKIRRIPINAAVKKALVRLPLADPSAPLFPSRKGSGFLTVPAVSRLVKKWCEDCGFKGDFSSHTLRKTWAFFQYYHFKTDLAEISNELNHSSLKMTYKYLGITPKSVEAMYAREI